MAGATLPPDSNVHFNPYPTRSGKGKFYLARIGRKITGSAPVAKRFTKDADARRWIIDEVAKFEDRLKRHGEASAELTPQQYSAAMVAIKALGDCPASTFSDLAEFWVAAGRPATTEFREFTERVRKLGKNPWPELVRGLAYFTEHCPEAKDQKTVTSVFEHWLALKTGKAVRLRDRSKTGPAAKTLSEQDRQGASDYTRGMRTTLKRFAKTFGHALFHAVNADQCQTWLDNQAVKNNSKRHYVKDLNTIWNWAVKPMKFAKVNPWPEVNMPPKDSIFIGILTPWDCLKLLRVAATNPRYHRMLASLVCNLLGGVRAKESTRLKWHHIRLTGRRPLINLAADVAKTRHRRVVKLSANAVKWLELVPLDMRHGKIRPGDWDKLFAALRQEAGVLIYPRNCLRHSYASYHASIHGETRTAEQLGHCDLGTIKEHYQENVLPEEADAFWAMVPETTDAELELMLKAA